MSFSLAIFVTFCGNTAIRIRLRPAALRFLAPKAFGVESLFEANQSKYLSMKNLHPKPGNMQSRPIKPNQT
jgi:hypothetical protein